MKEGLELDLVKSHPQIFRDYKGDATKTCMAWGMACGDGWYYLLHSLCKDLDKIAVKHNIVIIADQVKEKFGGLRFYYHIEGLEDDVFDKIRNKFQDFMFKRLWGVQYNKIIDFKKEYLFQSVKEKVREVVSRAEAKSCETCESCGNYGTYRRGGWVRVLCNKCEAENKRLK